MNKFDTLDAQTEIGKLAQVSASEVFTSKSGDARANWKAKQRATRKAQSQNAVAKAIERNERKEFKPIRARLQKLAKQIRREVEAVLQPERERFDALMAL